MDAICGLNVLEFVLVAWGGCVAMAVACDVGSEVYQEQKQAWREKHPKNEESETTTEMPVGSFDPETTISIPKIQKQTPESVFIIYKRPAGRHAKI